MSCAVLAHFCQHDPPQVSFIPVKQNLLANLLFKDSNFADWYAVFPLLFYFEVQQFFVYQVEARRLCCHCFWFIWI